MSRPGFHPKSASESSSKLIYRSDQRRARAGTRTPARCQLYRPRVAHMFLNGRALASLGSNLLIVAAPFWSISGDCYPSRCGRRAGARLNISLTPRAWVESQEPSSATNKTAFSGFSRIYDVSFAKRPHCNRPYATLASLNGDAKYCGLEEDFQSPAKPKEGNQGEQHMSSALVGNVRDCETIGNSRKTSK